MPQLLTLSTQSYAALLPASVHRRSAARWGAPRHRNYPRPARAWESSSSLAPLVCAQPAQLGWLGSGVEAPASTRSYHITTPTNKPTHPVTNIGPAAAAAAVILDLDACVALQTNREGVSAPAWGLEARITPADSTPGVGGSGSSPARLSAGVWAAGPAVGPQLARSSVCEKAEKRTGAEGHKRWEV